MATEYTPNYNLDLYASDDKPNLRDQYNAAMGKIDTQMKKSADDVTNANANVLTLQTQMTEAQKDIAELESTVDEHGTEIAELESTVDEHGTEIADTQADVTALTGRVTTVEGTANTNKTDIASLQTSVNGKAPTAHASTASTYGLGTSSSYGHVKLSDSVGTSSGAGLGVAATPTAVKAVNDSLVDLKGELDYLLLKNYTIAGESGSISGDAQLVFKKNVAILRLNGASITVPSDPNQWQTVVNRADIPVSIVPGLSIYAAGNTDYETDKACTLKFDNSGFAIRRSGSSAGAKLTVYGELVFIANLTNVSKLRTVNMASLPSDESLIDIDGEKYVLEVV